MKIAARALAVLGILLFAAADAGAAGHQVRIPFSMRSWDLETPDGETVEISQWVGMSWVNVAMAEQWDLAFATSASGTDVTAAADASLSGTKNLRTQVFGTLSDDRLLLQGGLNLPTGKTELTAEEISVARALWNPVLGFPVRSLGEGFGGNLGLSWAQPAGDSWVLGIGGSATMSGAFTVAEGGEEYRPGNVFSLTAGADGRFDPLTLHLDATSRFFGKDQEDGEEIFQEGSQFETRGGGTYASGSFSLSARLLTIIKSRNTYISGGSSGVVETKQNAGRSMKLSGEARLQVHDAWGIGLAGEWIDFSDREADEETGSATGFGPVVTFHPSEPFSVFGRYMILSGSLASGATDLSGQDVSVALAWTP